MPKKSEQPTTFCCMCGAPVNRKPATMAYQRRTGRPFCSTTCSTKYRSAISSETMARTNRTYASERMKRNNPMAKSEIRAKVSNTLREIGHKPKVRGGNGAPPTEAEMKLMNLFGPIGFVSQFVVATGHPRGTGPQHYKIDCANPTLKIAIEADGASHAPLERQASDARKDAFLSGRGWKVFRFSNTEILTSPAVVWSTISKWILSTHTSPTE